MYIMCVCLFSALSRRVGALQISIIIINNGNNYNNRHAVATTMTITTMDKLWQQHRITAAAALSWCQFSQFLSHQFSQSLSHQFSQSSSQSHLYGKNAPLLAKTRPSAKCDCSVPSLKSHSGQSSNKSRYNSYYHVIFGDLTGH